MSHHEFAICHDDISEIFRLAEPASIDTMRGPAWMRRFLNWTLHKLDAKAPRGVERVKVRRFSAPDGSIIERLRLQQRDMMRLYNREARVVFIGPDLWSEAEAETLRASRVMSFDPVDVRLGGRDGIRVLGVEFVLVPWMTGALLVPDWKVRP